MRVLHITTAFPREPGDVITPWLVELLKRLRAEGVDAEVLTSSYKGAPDQTFEGIPVHRFRYFLRRWENLTHEETAPDRMRPRDGRVGASRAPKLRVRITCVYPGFRAVLADLEEAKIR